MRLLFKAVPTGLVFVIDIFFYNKVVPMGLDVSEEFYSTSSSYSKIL